MKKRIFIALPGRLSRKAATPPSRHCGYSIIQVSLSLVLLAVSAALALPSYREMTEKQQLTHGAEPTEKHGSIQMHGSIQRDPLDLEVGDAGAVILCSDDVNRAVSGDKTCPDDVVAEEES